MKLNKRIFRFAAVGFVNTAVDFLIFNIGLLVFGLAPVWAGGISATAAMFNSFLLNKLWTFEGRSSGHGTAKQTVLFFGFTIFGVVANTFLVGLFATLLVGAFPSVDAKLLANIGKVGVTAMILVYNFVVYNFIVFRSGDKETLPQEEII